VVGKKSLADNLAILFDVCDAVSFAHSKGVVHRDLKPENVMLGEFGEVQLLDWGMGASVSSEGTLANPSWTQAAGGTPAYMAPEMVTGEDGPVGVHSDVYLLGGILYEIVTSKPPHAGKRVLDSLENARKNVIQPTEHSGILVDIALEAMRTSPADRYPSAGDFKQALLEYQVHEQSITLCERSAGDLHAACDDKNYELFAQALFGFRQALTFWEGNAEARDGVVKTQSQYARCAFEKADLDLASSLLDGDVVSHRDLAGEIEGAQRRRDAARRRFRMLRIVAVSLTAAVIVILAVASIWIYTAKRQAVSAKEEAIVAKEVAVSAREAEAEQRKLAETSMARAQEEEGRAVKALSDLVEAQEQEKLAWAEARASEQAATETRDELAKTGMLLDNSWWVFDAATARKMQEDTASSIGMPTELTISVAGGAELVMVLVPPAAFVMGSPPKEESRSADEHLHRVSHSHAFYLSKFELTEGQWQALTGESPPGAVDRAVDPSLPSAGVSFEAIVGTLLPAIQSHAPDGWRFRLPTEAEWEYACRAGTSTAYHAGDDLDSLESVGWFLFNSERKVRPIGLKTPNAFGLHDMHGNVGEICADQYIPGYYLESPTDDPLCSNDGEIPVVRGGSVLNTPEHCRSAYRSYVYDKNEYPFLGVRPAMVLVSAEASPGQPEPAGAPPTDLESSPDSPP
jgi:formylglycine-generating enzyme required for sulfatase activity